MNGVYKLKLLLLKKITSLLIVLALIVGLVPNTVTYAADNLDTDELEDELITQISEITDDVEIENTSDSMNVNTEISFDDEQFDLSEEEIGEDFSNEDVNVEPFTVTNANVTLSINIETNEIKVISKELDADGNEQINEYSIDTENAVAGETLEATFTDLETGEKYDVNSEELKASFVWFAIPIGVVIGEALLAHLISIGLAATISGVTYIAISEFLKKDRSKKYNHYMVHLDNKKKFLGVGNGISATKAASRLKSGLSTWSTSKSNAQSVAKKGSPIGKALGPEIDKNKSGKLYHYHPIKGYKNGKSVRIEGAHAFYGSPQ